MTVFSLITQNKMSTKTIDKHLTINDTAEYFKVTKSTIRNWIKSGYLTISENKILFSDIKKLDIEIKSGNIEKLNKRANKSKAKKLFIPKEYFDNPEFQKKAEEIIDFILNKNLEMKKSLFILALNLLIKNNLLFIDIQKNFQPVFFRKNLEKIIDEWNLHSSKILSDKNYYHLLTRNLPDQTDLMGLIYQSLKHEGSKSREGSYYTPKRISDDIACRLLQKNFKVLDPCCGTGQFLLSFSKIITNPGNIYGCDIDEMAVMIAKINLIIKYNKIDFYPNIICLNILIDNTSDYYDFDLIATNPPWGYHYNADEIKILKNKYPEINSLESFSYFIKKSIDMLKKNSLLSFVLPQSILQVKSHNDIRKIILSESEILNITSFDQIFKNVFSKVIRLDLKKTISSDYKIKIFNKDLEHYIDIKKFLNNKNLEFNISSTDEDEEIIQKIYNLNHLTLKNNADWAMGIVTGSNNKFLENKKTLDNEEVILGKDISPFFLKKSKTFIKFQPEIFQQTADEKLYRAEKKLIYKFISKKLVFAYDDKKRLTLNSANILIPILDYPVKVILALFNSSLYTYLYAKKFSSIKILRSHLEELPLPILSENEYKTIISLVDKILINKNFNNALDDYIMKIFSLTLKEKKRILNCIQNL